MRHLLLRAQLGTVPLQTCQWVLTEEAGVSRWQLLSQDGRDTGLRTATRELGMWALWVATASPQTVAEQLRLDDWSDEALNRLRQARAVLERLQARAYRHKEKHHHADLAWLKQLLQQAEYCLSAPDIGGMDALERVGAAKDAGEGASR